MNIKQQLKKAYDADAQRRVDNEMKRDKWKLNLRKKFAKLAKKEKKQSLLELGSGVGIDADYFKKNGFDVFATDFSKEMINKCKTRGLNSKVVDLYELNSLNRSFDSIYSMNVLLHIPLKDLDEVLQTIHNVLNDNGIFFYGVYSKGKDEEFTFTDNSKMGLPRFFSFLSDKTLLDQTQKSFDIVDFSNIDIGNNEGELYFQALTLRKKPLGYTK